MTKLSERLLSLEKEKYNFSDKRWVVFLKDHRRYLIENSERIDLDPNVVNSFRYHTTALLIELQLESKMEWLIKWLNQIKGEWEVVELDSILVPSSTVIDTLWDKYKSFKSKKDKLR